jgi:hypothetical protein
VSDLISLIPRELLLLLAAITLVLWWRAETRGARRSRRVNARAQAAESDAETLLVGAGYRLLDRQAQATLTLRINGELVDVGCRADLLVARGGLVFVAECKSGPVVSDPTFPATRRQLLEYLLAFDVDGALLIDMHTRRIIEVAWPEPDA